MSEREQFETAYRQEFGKRWVCPQRQDMFKRETNRYAHLSVQDMWVMWQAARAQPAQAGQVLTDDQWQLIADITESFLTRDMKNEIEAVLAKRVPQWIATADQMPPPDAWLLVVWDGGRVDKAHTFNKWEHPTNPLGYLIQGHPGAHADVTHWMPLPPPPGIVSGKGGA